MLDIPHMIATAIIMAAVLYAIDHLPQTRGMTGGKRAAVLFAVLFVLLFAINLIWPYGSGA